MVVVAVLDEAVIGPFDDGKAEVQRVAERIETLALGQAALERRFVEGEERRVVLVDAHECEIIGQIDRKQSHAALRAICSGIFEPIGLRLERRVGDHVVVGDRKPVGRDQKAGAGRGLAAGIGQEGADLQQSRRSRGIDGVRASERLRTCA